MRLELLLELDILEEVVGASEGVFFLLLEFIGM
jgi:hypothetical protein